MIFQIHEFTIFTHYSKSQYVYECYRSTYHWCSLRLLFVLNCPFSPCKITESLHTGTRNKDFPSLHFIVSCGQVIKFRPIGHVQKRDEQLPGWTVHELECELVVSRHGPWEKTALRDSRTARAKEPEPLTALWSRATTPSPIYRRESKKLFLFFFFFNPVLL